jgi:hypothetical protein
METDLLLGKIPELCDNAADLETRMRAKILLALAAMSLGGLFSAPCQTWTQTSAPQTYWFCVAASADATKLVAVATFDNRCIYTSTNSGSSWIKTTAPSNNWISVASSADGSKLIAANYSENSIYTSSDSGTTWHSNSLPSLSWQAVTSSADGNRLMALAGGQVYTSSNSGAIWISNSLPAMVSSWRAGASSADGQKLIILSPAGQICISSNSGTTWQLIANAPGPLWYSVSMSADGNKLIALLQWLSTGGPAATVYTSTNFAQTWVSNNLPQTTWGGVAISGDGKKLFAIQSSTNVVSIDGGATWVSASTGSHGNNLISSADGNALYSYNGGPLAASDGGIYSSFSIASPTLNASPRSTNIIISWTIPSTNFFLEQNSDLTTTNWSLVTNTQVLNFINLQNQVMLPLSAGNVFFRLKTP